MAIRKYADTGRRNWDEEIHHAIVHFFYCTNGSNDSEIQRYRKGMESILIMILIMTMMITVIIAYNI